MHEFRIGSVLADSFRVLRRNIVVFIVLAVLVEAINFGQDILFDKQGISSSPGPDDIGIFNAVTLGRLAVDLFVNSLLVAPVTYVTYLDLRGKPAPLTRALGRGLAMVPKVFVLSAVFSILVFFGFILILVPGAIALVLWWMVVPVLVIERPGLWKCFRRSQQLTRGQRWKVLGIVMILAMVPIGIGTVILGILQLAFPSLWVAVAVDRSSMAIWSLVMATGSAVGYFHLRRAKEGVEIEDIAAVFD